MVRRKHARGSRGFVYLLEVVLALMVLYMVINQMQTIMASRYADPANMQRLYRFSKDIGLSICGNDLFRPYLVNGSLPPEGLTWWNPAWLNRVALDINGTYFAPYDQDDWTENSSARWQACIVFGCPTLSDSGAHVTKGARSFRMLGGVNPPAATYDINVSDLTAYDRLEFDLFTDSNTFTFQLRDTGGNTATCNPNFTANTDLHITASFRDNCTAPAGFNWTGVRYFDILGEASKNYYIDKLYFKGSQRNNEPIEWLLTAPVGRLANCTKEVRVVREVDGEETPSQVYNETTSGGNRSCNVVFVGNLLKNKTTTYHIYFNNPLAEAPGYTDEVTVSRVVGLATTMGNSGLTIGFDESSGFTYGEINHAINGTTDLAYMTAGDGGFARTSFYTYDGWAEFGRNLTGGGFWGTGPINLTVRNDGPVFADFERRSNVTTTTPPILDAKLVTQTFRVYRLMPIFFEKTNMTIGAVSTIRAFNPHCGAKMNKVVTPQVSMIYHSVSNNSFVTPDGAGNNNATPPNVYIAETYSASNFTGYAQFAYGWATDTATPLRQANSTFYTSSAAGRDYGSLGTACGPSPAADIALSPGKYNWWNAYYLSGTNDPYFLSKARNYYSRLAFGNNITATYENYSANFAWAVPPDIDYHVYLYNGSGGYQLRNLIDEAGNMPPAGKQLTAHSCLVSGAETTINLPKQIYLNSRCRCGETYLSAYNCTESDYTGERGIFGPDYEDTYAACTFRLGGFIGDNFVIQRNPAASTTFIVSFAVPYESNAQVLLNITAVVSNNGAIRAYVYNKTTGLLEQVGFFIYTDTNPGNGWETNTYDLTGWLPDYYGMYNVTIVANTVGITYDIEHVNLLVIPTQTSMDYNPKKVTVRTWNRNG